jgi:hypothetical protein
MNRFYSFGIEQDPTAGDPAVLYAAPLQPRLVGTTALDRSMLRRLVAEGRLKLTPREAAAVKEAEAEATPTKNILPIAIGALAALMLLR